MPFTALRNGGRILPYESSGDDSLTCPKCGDSMTVVSEHPRQGGFVARHFRHQTNEECQGESVPHLRMKSIAFSKLTATYPNATVSIEESVGFRRADVLVEFPEPRKPLGKGIAVEVQYQNNSKDLFATDQDYYDLGYSVLWLSEQHYDGYDVTTDHVQPVWPNSLPKLRGYDGLTWPLVEESSSLDLQVHLPPECLRRHSRTIREAFEQGREQRLTNTWVTHRHVWLSKRHQKTNRALQLVESPSGAFYLKLSKGKKGQRPAFVNVPLDASDEKHIGRVPEAFKSTLEKDPTEGEWQDLEICWLKGYDQPITTWLKIVSTPDNSYLLELGKKTTDNGSEKVKTGFSLTEQLCQNVCEFFEGLKSDLS